ncbi:MAG TPA: hypothetical protein VM573_05880 [Actinomycetota bacterium]|jgi:hypothetical protein|nr:hypothetical protein [Actinomycetota bacterium]
MQRLRSLLYSQSGQTTAEYATTLLVAVLITGALGAFVKGGGLDGLFEHVVEQVVRRAGR